MKPETWIKPLPQGLFVEPGGFFIDPPRGSERAVITHGHADHARSGNTQVLATKETLAIMRARYGAGAAISEQALGYGEAVRIGEVTVTLFPAGHVLGSSQVLLEYGGRRVVVSGDYKRRRDPTCPLFEPVPCDVFITEATFALPVFRHPADTGEIEKLLHSLRTFPERTHLVGVYGLGKCQRVIRLLREAGYDRPLYLHGALEALCALYENLGVSLGDVRPVAGTNAVETAGQIVLCPPSALNDRWSRRFKEPVTAMASGWMRVRQRAKQSGIELPLIISDHADWDELLQTIDDVDAPEIWVTHGREEALVHVAAQKGKHARALHLVGYEDEGGAEPA